MRYYEVILTSGPTHVFAFHYETDHYHWEFEKHEGQIEITYQAEGNSVMTSSRVGHLAVPQGCVKCMFYHEDTVMHSESPKVKLVTFSFYCDYTMREITAKEVNSLRFRASADRSDYALRAILPEMVPAGHDVETLVPIIKRVIAEHASTVRFGSMKTMAAICAALAELTEISMRMAAAETGKAAVNDPYTAKVVAYIREHLTSPLSLPEIACSLGISTGHLSRLFKLATGYGVIEYANRMRIMLARELVERPGESVAHAAAQVGFTDEKYFSRLFKKITGMTVTQYRASQNVAFK